MIPLASLDSRGWWRGQRGALGIALLAGALAAALVLWLIGDMAVACGFVAAALVLAGVAVVAMRLRAPEAAGPAVEHDWELVRSLAESSDDAVAITDRGGKLVCANDRYEQLFGGFPTPPALPLVGDGAGQLAVAGRAAWRDGTARASLRGAAGAIDAVIARTGQQQDFLIWRFLGAAAPTGQVARLLESIDGGLGHQLGAAGVMAALITANGHVLSANAVLRTRATGTPEGTIVDEDLARFLSEDPGGTVRFLAEGASATPLRLLQIPLGDDPDAPILVAMVDVDNGIAGGGAAEDLEGLLMLMPFGVALVDREGRFTQMNRAFARAASVEPGATPTYPGDLVVREDKAAVADAIRRASGGGRPMDLAVRLKDHPDEPVALSIAAARGLGDAAVLLSLKDNGEENRLKREVAQATKMQAVGQLAGGVAHDFNNILTAIIGHCDLMLMRHSPGDSDYDDIQQIRANSNRAASLTRQLLAFSRQQTLRPQVLQLPDVVSEVSNLLRRLMGETVTLEVKHGRDLGPVRADPGQLEQVVVNLAVNARDAMLSKGTGGKLTIQTRSVPIAEIRRRGSDIVPIGDYTALDVSDTGTGIPPEVLPKIFEPFFTTKDVGKGTGLGLSTVYGIVKQSGGFIFADSRPGQGATFTIYLPVYAAGAAEAGAAPAASRPAPRQRSGDLWGSGTILLVEDEDMVRAVAERALARQGYTVLAAENGEAALELMEGVDRPTLVISDVMMPVMDGPTLARQLRQAHPNIPILFMSGYAEEQLRRSIDLDNVAFLPKPFSVQQLAEATRDVLVAQEARDGS